jgi:uncharacterized protein (UPF0305 family)
MKKRKFLQTDFIKFILEKYAQSQDLPDDEIEMPDDEQGEDVKQKRIKRLNELEDEEEPIDDEQGDDEIIDELLNEYKRLKRKYESKSNRLPIRRKR